MSAPQGRIRFQRALKFGALRFSAGGVVDWGDGKAKVGARAEEGRVCVRVLGRIPDSPRSSRRIVHHDRRILRTEPFALITGAGSTESRRIRLRCRASEESPEGSREKYLKPAA